MAYSGAQTRNQRVAVLTTVAMVHAVVGFAAVTGLAVKVFEHPRDILTAVDIPADIKVLDPPPPPPRPQREKPVDQPRIIDQIRDPGVDLTIGGPGTIFIPPSGPVDFVKPPSDTKPLQAVAPIQAKPRNNPGSWASPDDYPSRPYRMGIEGVSRFHVTVGASGRVEGCTITGTSGDSDLDAATCRLVTSRARFEPAKDSAGNKVPGEYSSSIRWVIPH